MAGVDYREVICEVNERSADIWSESLSVQTETRGQSCPRSEAGGLPHFAKQGAGLGDVPGDLFLQ